MGMVIKHIDLLEMGMGENEKPPRWEWELPALTWEFIPIDFLAAFSLLSY